MASVLMLTALSSPTVAQGHDANSFKTMVEANSASLMAAKSNLDMIWIVVAAGLVLLMQVGFMLLEAGMVRSKNSVNVAQKNLLDFTFAVILFACVGFMFAFSASNGFVFGIDPAYAFLSDLDAWGLTFFTFQVMFCGTAATIVSGAVAERMPIGAYVLGSIVIAAFIYPIFVHWAWGSALVENDSAFLADMGFVDFAGSTVVHGTGAWVALAACLLIGPRKGRFDQDGKPVRIHGHSPVLATAGAFLLFVGWIGFNGGSTLEASPDVASIIANTVVAAATGTAAGHLVCLWQRKLLLPEKLITGLLGGLVAVTAGAAVLNIQGALIIGALGGSIAVWSVGALEKFRIDDAVGAIGIHGFAGIVGTIGLAFLAPVSSLPLENRIAQALIQAFGVGVNFVWAFGLGYLTFKLISSIVMVRVSAESEEVGLNQSEHGTRIGIGHIEDAFDHLVQGKTDLSLRLAIDEGDEAERLSRLFNAMMDAIQNEEVAKSSAADQQRAEEEAERLSALANATFEAIVIAVDGKIVDGNSALEKLVGFPLADLQQNDLQLFVHEEDRAFFAERFELASGDPYEIKVNHKDGSPIPAEVRTREIIYRGQRTKVAAIADLRERKVAEEKIRYLAQHDHLTGLPNRAVFSQKLDDMVQQSEKDGRSFALLLIDLDHFKDINDLHGHAAGDAVIRETATRMIECAGSFGTVARLGGDEFGLLLHNLEFSNQAADFAHRLTIRLSKPVTGEDGTLLHTGASIGIVICPESGTEVAQLLSRADTALYKAKKMGRNTYCLFERGMDEEDYRRRVLEADLSVALSEEQFELYFQPRMTTDSGNIESFEALIRWIHPQKGMIGPAEFIPVAEQSGKIIGIGNWVIRQACLIAKRTLGSARVSINVSPLQFRDKELVNTIAVVLKETDLPPQQLEIEITESVLIDDDERALATLRALKKMGCRIALDDFGTGYSSLSYLSRFPFDCIKIDRSFVQGISQTEHAGAIVQTIIRLGQATNMTIVAEGVEQVDELQMLVEMGCDEIQGFLIGRPASIINLQLKTPDSVLEVLYEGRNNTVAVSA
jgi:ammonium transporter, Amt family